MLSKGVGRKFSRGGEATEKKTKNSKQRPKNSTFKPLCTIFVPCMKIQEEATAPCRRGPWLWVQHSTGLQNRTSNTLFNWWKLNRLLAILNPFHSSKQNKIRIQIAATAKIFNGENIFYWNLNVFGHNIGPSSETLNKLLTFY